MTAGTSLIIDGANVVGSVPDGWWRDRAGAARRLHDRLADGSTFTADVDEVILVLEGQARPGVPEGLDGRLRTVHAPADGDATMIALTAGLLAAGRAVTVVTADRALRAEIVRRGGRVVGPSALEA